MIILRPIFNIFYECFAPSSAGESRVRKAFFAFFLCPISMSVWAENVIYEAVE